MSLTEQDLARHVQSLLDDPAHQGHPLHDALQRLLAYSEEQNERLARLVRISDGYHSISHSRQETLTQQYDKQLRRLEKLTRISDRYQNSLRELSDALRDSAARDALTGLNNRRFLTQRLQEETRLSHRKGHSYALGILDIDHFKRINDQFGHVAGDKVIVGIGQAIQTALREYDICGRWGGEEFLILLPETDAEAARSVAERVRLRIAELGPALEPVLGQTHPISASLGWTQYRSGEDFSETLTRADNALLAAKSAGRDRTVFIA